jgi:hypothetical protein
MKRGKDYDYSQVAVIEAAGEKVCTKCGVRKSLDDFHARKGHPLGKVPHCKPCCASRFKEYREKNLETLRYKDRIAAYVLKFGVSKELAKSWVDNKQGVCEICCNVKDLVTDHCHTSGKIRGRICSACNSVLGYSKDNIDTLLAAISYLNRNRDE